MEYIELEYTAISTSTLENNNHVVLLSEKNDTFQLPVIVNKMQASAISAAIERT